MLLLVLSLPCSGKAQNLVPNGSFEEYIDCPFGLGLLEDVVVGWSSSRGTCDYYNACAPACGVSVPCNVAGWQEALIGTAYAGFVGTDFPELSYREHMTAALVEPLIIGETYYFSMYVNNGIVLEQSPNKACNGQGAWFTTELRSSIWDDDPMDNPSPVLNAPQILNLEVVDDSTNWVRIAGSFVADSAYTYVVIGGFLDSEHIQVVNVSGEGPFENNGEAYYFVDEVRLSTDSAYVFQDPVGLAEEMVGPRVSVWPNPVEDILEVSFHAAPLSVMIFDIHGRKLLEVMDPGHQESLDMKRLSAGLYMVQVTDSNGRRHSVRVIKTE